MEAEKQRIEAELEELRKKNAELEETLFAHGLNLAGRERAVRALLESEERFHAFVDNAPIGIAQIQYPYVVFANKTLLTMFGFGISSDVVGTEFLDYIAPSAAEELKKGIETLRMQAMKTPVTLETIGMRKDSSEFYMAVTLRGEIRPEGFSFICYIQDITERKAADLELRRAKDVYKTIFENAVEGIYQSMPEGRFIKVNPAMASIFGYSSPDEMINSIHDMRNHFYTVPEDRDTILELLKKDGSFTGFETQLNRKDGEPRWVSLSASAIKDRNGKILHIEGLAEDITDRKERELKLKEKATIDALTGLPNRYHFEQTFNHMLAQAKRCESRLAVLYIDPNRFKIVNDSYGHFIGDELLKDVASRLASMVRESDAIGRLGGDEFVILLWNIADEKDVTAVADKINSAFQEPFDLHNGVRHTLSLSIGASVFPDHGDDVYALLDKADKAMYRVKLEGPGHYKMYTPRCNVPRRKLDDDDICRSD